MDEMTGLELEWLDDESLVQTVLLKELNANLRVLFSQVRSLHCGCALLRFLVTNDHSLLTIDDIAFHLFETPTVVESNLRSLAELGLVRRVDAEGITWFGVTGDLAQRALAGELCAWQNRWKIRLRRIERVVIGETP